MPLGSILGSSLCADSSHLLVPSTPSFIALSSDHCLPFCSCFCHHLADFSIHMDEPPTTLASQSLNLSFMTCLSSFQPLTLMVTSLPQSLSPRSQLKASHSLTTMSCLSSKSALGFPCLPLFLFSACRYLAPESLLQQSASSRPHSTPPLQAVLAVATMGHLNATSLLPPTHLRFSTSITSCRKPSKIYPDWLCTLPFYAHSMLVISQRMLPTLSTLSKPLYSMKAGTVSYSFLYHGHLVHY